MNCPVYPEIKLLGLFYSRVGDFCVFGVFFFCLIGTQNVETFLQIENSVLIPENVTMKYLDRILSGVYWRTAFLHLYTNWSPKFSLTLGSKLL